ncbi:acyl-CoA synthetase [Parasphingorhabdus sp. JC815]|uniref:acyl-CoA synthetase n=1 Tax=Parasphingorhabdus sp. JC815 TaxID=3232140 RepID=UPI003458256C
MDWNLGNILDELGLALGSDDLALIHGDRVISWPEMTIRSNRMARALLERGVDYGDKAGFYLRNQPEYMEGVAACFKARLVPVNVNYRYLDDELYYIFDNSDSAVVFYDAEFRDNVARVRPRLPKVKIWIEIGEADETPNWAVNYEDLVSEGDGSPLNIERSGDDMFFLYTGGTTGMPKGVMWTQAVWHEAGLEALAESGLPVPETMADHISSALETGRLARQIPACPLMHGTGFFTALGTMVNGGCVVTLQNNKSLDVEEIWTTVQNRGVTKMAIVGDAFAKPLLLELDENPEKYDVSSMQAIVSSGVMWSMEVKKGLIRHMPQVALMDSFGASEAIGFGASVTTAEGVSQTSKFQIGGNCKVFTEDDREVQPGSGERGFIARGGAVPLGYYKDKAKTDSTFRVINGARYAIPGDWCTVESDGTLTLIGRGSNCINTAGEKVFPEEVEEALKEHSNVKDALVIGLPDEKWGSAVTAVVSLDGETDEANLKTFVRNKLAAYKSPKRIFFKDDLNRAANGKADYKSITAFAVDQLQAEA